MRKSTSQSIILLANELHQEQLSDFSDLEPNVSLLTTHIDNMHVRPDPSIGIDQVREIKQFLITKPLENFKMVFVHHAHKMTLQAQNAALKLLEEPPSYGYIFLITPNPFLLIDTIRSRCTVISNDRVEASNTNNNLSKYSTMSLSEKMQLTDSHSKSIPDAREFLEVLVKESREHMISHPTNNTLFNVLISLHGLKMLSVNTNPRLVIDYVLFRLKPI